MTTPTVSEIFQNNPHPRLFFSPSDITGLQEKSQAGVYRPIREQILNWCQRHAAPADSHYVDPNWSKKELLRGFGGGRLNDSAHALHGLAFGYMLTGDRQWADQTGAIITSFIGSNREAAKLVENPEMMFESICAETLANNLTFVYDFCYDALAPALRQAIHQHLHLCLDKYRSEFLHHPKAHKFGLGNNTFWRGFEKYVITLAATWTPGEDEQWTEDLIAHLRRSLHRGLDEGGTLYEGPGYGWRDAEWLAYMAEVLNRMELINLWQDEPRYARMMRNWAYLVLPNGAEPTRAPHVFTNMFFGGRAAAFSAGKDADYGRVDIGEQWECHWAYRHVMMVKQPGAPTYFLVFDDMNYDPSHRRYVWQMNSETGNRIAVDPQAERAVVNGKTNRQEVVWSYPAAGSYPKDHWLEVYTDELKFGLILDFGTVRDTVVASPVDHHLDCGGLFGEASLAVVRRAADESCTWWAAADAWSLAVDGESLLPCQADTIVLAKPEAADPSLFFPPPSPQKTQKKQMEDSHEFSADVLFNSHPIM